MRLSLGRTPSMGIQEIFHTLLHSEEIIRTGGLILILLIVFAETGLFIGFFLPGDYLLFSAGLFCGSDDLNINIFLLLIYISAAAIAGNTVGYWIGNKMGQQLFKRGDTFFFKRTHLEKTKLFYGKHGAKAIVFGRFFPVIRTFVPIFAGAINLHKGKFFQYNAIGAILWVWTLVPLGYFLGWQYPQIKYYIHYIILFFFVITLIPVVLTALKLR